MQPVNLHAFTIESLEGQLRADELRLSGTLRTTSAYTQLERHLAQVHDHIVHRKYPSFIVDVRLLSFVNSSAIRLFINWIAQAERAAYKLVFLTERSVTWHRLSFSALRDLAPQSVEVRDRHPSERATP